MKNQNALHCLAVLIALYGILNSTPSARAQDNLLITEFLANNSTINDDFGQSSDYIELFNGGATAINLSAYYLTDNLDNLQKWRIPAVNLAPGQHLIIWASGRDLTDPTKPLHANFSLSLNGEALALVRGTNNIVQQFVFGPQVLNRSYGLNSEVISTSTLIGAGTIAQYYTPTNSGNTFTNRWQQRDFIVPPNWSSGPLGIGFDTNSSSLFDSLIATDVEGLMNGATRRNTLMVRIPFQITSLGQVPNPYLSMRYDDGFVAYLNGREIARRGFSPTTAPTGTSTATQNRANDAAIVAEDIFSTALVEGFQEGANVLSFYAVRNSAAADGDLLLLPEIKTRQVRYNLADERYFSTPSPGSANSSGIDDAAGPVSFSAASKTYFDPFDVTLIPPTGLANVSVHYTLNGTVPTTNSPRYSGPIRLTNSVSIRARAFVPTYLPGPIRTETFMRLDPAMRDVSSDLPLVLVHSFGTGGFDDANKRPCVVFVHEPFRGRSSFTNAPDQIFRAGFKIRGSSTAGNPKFNWAVDSWGEDDLDENIPLLGLPSASEWVFHGPFNFDPSLFHNPLASDMSNEIGRYASRYKNIEVYLNQTSPSSTSGSATSNIRRTDYFGVYNVLERIGIGPNRVNTPRLTAQDLTQPNVTGGYLLSIDRSFGGSSGFSGAGQGINYIDPKFEDISTAERDPQEQYLTSWFNEFGRTLNPEVRFLNSDVTDAAGFVARLSSRSNGALDYLFRRFSDEGYLFQGEASGSAIVSILNRLQSNVLTGPVSFAPADIRSLNPLAARLLAGEGAFDSWLKSQLTAETLSLLAIYNTPAAQPATSNTLRTNIVRDLNVIIAGPSIHNGSRFASVSLRKLTEYFLEKNVAGDDLLYMNRLLIEDGFPTELARRTRGTLYEDSKIAGISPFDAFMSAGPRGLLALAVAPTTGAPAQRLNRMLVEDLFPAQVTLRRFGDPVAGYPAYLDVGAAIDHHIVNVISFNVDALRLSGYFYKDRDSEAGPGKLVFGPVWDFDRAFGSTDGRDENPFVWKSQTGDGGTDFFNYPWWDRWFTDPAFWQAYIDRYQQLREGIYSTPSVFAMMDRLNDQVKESAPRDLAKWQNAKRGGSQASEMVYFKNWIKNRLFFMDTNFLAKPRPETVNVSGNSVTITLSGPAGATIYYTLDGTDPREAFGSVHPSAKIYSGPISATGDVRLVARSRNPAHRNLTGAGNPPISSPWSGPMSARYAVDALAGPADLVVTEINYNPAAPTASELNINSNLTRNAFEFLEIRNISNRRVDIYGARFTAGINFTFDDSSTFKVEPGAHLLLVKDLAAFRLRYGNGPAVAGVFTGDLADEGERIRLEDSSNQELFELTYNDAWEPATDGLGFTLNRGDLALGDSSREGWRPSSRAGGSPGAINPDAPAIPRVLLNEVLANAPGSAQDTVELVNRSPNPADIVGWFLTDDRSIPTKYRIPENTPPIAAGGFFVITQNAFDSNAAGTNAFGLFDWGDDVWLFAADRQGNLLGYAHGASFGPSEELVPFGRHITSAGRELFVAQSASTFGQPNSGPKVGPLVITEIMYHPTPIQANGRYWDNSDDEFVEVQNITALPLSLSSIGLGSTWRLRGEVDYDFPTNLVVQPGEILVIVEFDPALEADRATAFRARWSVPEGTRLFGPFDGNLVNGKGNLRITRPVGDFDNNSRLDEIFNVVVDEIDYEDGTPWPAAADGAGASLQKRNRSLFGNDPASWTGALATPGRSFVPADAPVITQQPQGATVVGGTSASLSVVATGRAPLTYQWRRDGQNIGGATSATLTLNPILVSEAGSYTVIVLDGNGSVESTAAELIVLQPAVIVEQPESQNVRPGLTATFRVVAIGTGQLSYQWTKDGQDIPGATTSTLIVRNLVLEDTGDYRVRVTDSIGAALSSVARLTVLVRPVYTVQPLSVVALVGEDVTFSADATGLEPIAYRWRRGNTTIPGAVGKTYVLANVQLTNAGLYSCVATNLATGTSGTNSTQALLVVMNDSDGDGMGDQWEAVYGFSSSNAADAAEDTDGDNHTNLQEFQAGTNPKDKTSFLKIDSISVSANGASIGFLGQSNRVYTLQFRDDLGQGNWQNLGNVGGTTNQRPLIVIDPNREADERYYRLLAPPAK